MARRQVINTTRFQSLGGTARRYFDLKTGETISRREAIKRSTGLTPEALAASRAAREPRPNLDRLQNRIESMLRRGYSPDDIAHRTRVYSDAPGRGARKLGELGMRPSRELATAGTIRGIARGETAVSEKRANAILRALDNPEINFRAGVIGRDGGIRTLELVGESSAHKYHNYYDALVKMAAGDSSKFDSLKPKDFEVRIVGPSGNVETYRLNDNKAQLQRELGRGRLEDITLPDPETKRGKS